MEIFMKQRQLLQIGITLCILLFFLCGLSFYRSSQLPPSIFFQQEYAAEGQPLKVSTQGFPRSTTFTYLWKIGETPIANTTDTFTPRHEDLGQFISVTVTPSNDSESVTLSMYFSTLPVFYINTTTGGGVYSKEIYETATVSMQGNDLYNRDTTALYQGGLQIKCRGNSSYRTEKLSYKMRLDVSVDLMDMGANKHWILHANPFDDSVMRNKIAYDLSGELGMPYMKSTWVDVILNGKYKGIFQLCEQIRVGENRIEITDLEKYATAAAKALTDARAIDPAEEKALESSLKRDLQWLTTGILVYNDNTYDLSSYLTLPDINGGWLCELDAFYDEFSKFMVENQPIQVLAPEYIATNTHIMSDIVHYVTAFYNAVYFSEDFYADYKGQPVHYTQLFDMESMAKYFIMTEIFFNEDTGLKSTYFYKDLNEPAHMGPIWDMDYSSGGVGDHAYVYDQWQVIFYSNYSQANQWYKGIVRDPYFLSQALEVWNAYCDKIFRILEEDGPLETAYDYIYDSAVINFNLWQADGSLAETDPVNSQRFQNGYLVLTDWLTNHLTWLDQQFTTLDHLVESVGAFDGGAGVDLSRTGSTVTLTASQGHTVRWYYNGILQAEDLLQDGTLSWSVPSDQRIHDSDVIQVRVYLEDGTLLGSDYVDFR